MEQRTNQRFHDILKNKIDAYVHDVYKYTKSYPKDEIFGATSQHRRAALSVALNYIEGYARIRDKVYKNFLEISYGSLKESQYLVNFAFKEGWTREEEHTELFAKGDEVGAMIWSTFERFS